MNRVSGARKFIEKSMAADVAVGMVVRMPGVLNSVITSIVAKVWIPFLGGKNKV